MIVPWLMGVKSSTSNDILLKELRKNIAYVGPVPADISFLIADLKYKPGELKICEFGEGTRSRFKGYDHVYGLGTLWEMFWQHLRSYQFTPWYVGPALYSDHDRSEVAIDAFAAHGGHCVRSIDQIKLHIERNDKKKKKIVKNVGFDETSLNAYQHLLLFRHLDAGRVFCQKMRDYHAGILVLNSAVAPFVNNKYFTNVLFDDPELSCYKPQFMLCEKHYTPLLAQSIKKKIPAQQYVIKPLEEFKGRGIIMVKAAHLDKVLRRVLLKRDEGGGGGGAATDGPLYEYWQTNKDTHFLVEECCSSQELVIDEKRYDPTMRVIFILTYDCGQVNVTYLDAYWKIPGKALDERTSLTTKYKSIGTIYADVEEGDKREVQRMLNDCLPLLYKKMLYLLNEIE